MSHQETSFSNETYPHPSLAELRIENYIAIKST